MNLRNQISRFTAIKSIGIDIIVLALLFNSALIIVGVFPGTPINDDWAYARILEEFLCTGRFIPLDWIGMNQFTQTILAYPLAKFFGSGWNVLHIFTMAMGTGVLALTVVWMRQQGASRGAAFVIAFAWMANPIFVGLSGSFMTDVPFLSLLLLSFVFATRFLQEGMTFKKLVLFILSVVAAMLLRQPALWLTIAFPVAFFDKKKGWNNARLLIPVLCAVVAQGLFDYCVSQTGANFEMRRFLTARIIGHAKRLLQGDQELWRFIFYNVTDFSAYVAMMMIPLLPFWLRLVKRYWLGTTAMKRFGIAAAFAAGCLLVASAGMPPFRRDNIVGSLGLGPLTLRDGMIVKSHALMNIPIAFWVGIWWLTALTSGMMLAAWTGYFQKEGAWKQAVSRMVFAFAALYSLPFILTDFFDRYALPVLLCATAVLSNIPGQKNRKILILSWIWLLAWVVMAMVVAHDYQAWQHARWRAGQDLLGQGVDPKRIDGGFEFNSYYLYGRVTPTPGKSWWSVVDDEYLIAFSTEPFPNYRQLSVYEVGGLLPTTPKQVLILHRKEAR